MRHKRVKYWSDELTLILLIVSVISLIIGIVLNFFNLNIAITFIYVGFILIAIVLGYEIGRYFIKGGDDY